MWGDRQEPAARGTVNENTVPFDFGGPVGRPFRPLPEASFERPIFDLFVEAAAEFASKTAIDDGENYFTYREVVETAHAIAARIAATIAPGAPVGIALHNNSTYAIAMLAALAAGRPYVPLDLSFPENRNALILERSGMAAIIVSADTADMVRRMAPAMPQIDFAAAATAERTELPKSSPDDLALILFTSGSTGEPKGVYYDQRGLLYDAVRRVNCTHLSQDDRTAVVFAPTVAAGQQDVFGSLLNGATLFVVDVRRKGMQELVRALRRGRVTLLFCVPYVFRSLTELVTDASLLASIRHVQFAADRVFSADIELFRRNFPADSLVSIGLGSSELNLFTHWFVPRDLPMEQPLVPVGYVLPGYSAAIVGEDGKPVAPGEVGEIIVTSRYAALGYWQDEELTRAKFSPAPRDGKARIFRTGDLGRMRPDGLLDFVGRRDRLLKIRGNRVEPEEVEAVIRAHPCVADAAVFALECADGAELVAYAAVAKATPIGEKQLSEWLVPRLSDAMRPRRLRVVDAIPMLGNYKHDIPALIALEARRDAGIEEKKAPPDRVADDSVAAAVRAAWSRVLSAESFAANETWDEAGGDSLKGMTLVFHLETMLGRAVSMNVISAGSRPGDVAAALAIPTEAPVRCRKTGLPLLFSMSTTAADVLSYARLMDTLDSDFDIRRLDYPAYDFGHLQPMPFSDILAALLAQIRAQASKEEPFGLIGYSYGGFCAFETARALAEEGYKIEFVGILDVSPFSTSQRASMFKPKSVWNRITSTVVSAATCLNREVLVRKIVYDQLRRGHLGVIEMGWRLLTRLGFDGVRTIVGRETVRFLRLAAMNGYELGAYPGRIHVFKAADNRDWQICRDADLGWGPYCPDVEVRDVPGDHNTVLHGANFEVTKRVVLDAWHHAVEPAHGAG